MAGQQYTTGRVVAAVGTNPSDLVAKRLGLSDEIGLSRCVGATTSDPTARLGPQDGRGS